uniref:Uncharacterized protein n=1 Tax=Heterosigma akashiwo TaxID=2829 RepID=A0A7S3XZ85_HETAK
MLILDALQGRSTTQSTREIYNLGLDYLDEGAGKRKCRTVDKMEASANKFLNDLKQLGCPGLLRPVEMLLCAFIMTAQVRRDAAVVWQRAAQKELSTMGVWKEASTMQQRRDLHSQDKHVGLLGVSIYASSWQEEKEIQEEAAT